MNEEMTEARGEQFNLTVLLAAIVLVISVGLLFAHKLEPARAYTAMVFASCLAAHSVDQERRYRREVTRALVATGALIGGSNEQAG